MAEPTERDPLLQSTATYPDLPPADGAISQKIKKPLGPLEISKSTRWGILAGIWTANFLAVSKFS